MDSALSVPELGYLYLIQHHSCPAFLETTVNVGADANFDPQKLYVQLKGIFKPNYVQKVNRKER